MIKAPVIAYCYGTRPMLKAGFEDKNVVFDRGNSFSQNIINGATEMYGFWVKGNNRITKPMCYLLSTCASVFKKYGHFTDIKDLDEESKLIIEQDIKEMEWQEGISHKQKINCILILNTIGRIHLSGQDFILKN